MLNEGDATLEKQIAVVEVSGSRFLIPLTLFQKACPVMKGYNHDSALVRVSLQGVRPEIFQVIEDKIRTGKDPKLNIQNVIDIYCTAFGLQMKDLAAKCLRFILEKPRGDQCLVYYVECLQQRLEDEEREVMRYIGSNFTQVIAAQTFVQLSEEQLTQLLNDDALGDRPQEEKICATLRWLQHDCPGRKESITKLLEGFDPKNPAFEEVEICSEIHRRVPALKENQEERMKAKEKRDKERSRKQAQKGGDNDPMKMGDTGGSRKRKTGKRRRRSKGRVGDKSRDDSRDRKSSRDGRNRRRSSGADRRRRKHQIKDEVGYGLPDGEKLPDVNEDASADLPMISKRRRSRSKKRERLDPRTGLENTLVDGSPGPPDGGETNLAETKRGTSKKVERTLSETKLEQDGVGKWAPGDEVTAGQVGPPALLKQPSPHKEAGIEGELDVQRDSKKPSVGPGKALASRRRSKGSKLRDGERKSDLASANRNPESLREALQQITGKPEGSASRRRRKKLTKRARRDMDHTGTERDALIQPTRFPELFEKEKAPLPGREAGNGKATKTEPGIPGKEFPKSKETAAAATPRTRDKIAGKTEGSIEGKDSTNSEQKSKSSKKGKKKKKKKRKKESIGILGSITGFFTNPFKSAEKEAVEEVTKSKKPSMKVEKDPSKKPAADGAVAEEHEAVSSEMYHAEKERRRKKRERRRLRRERDGRSQVSERCSSAPGSRRSRRDRSRSSRSTNTRRSRRDRSSESSRRSDGETRRRIRRRRRRRNRGSYRDGRYSRRSRRSRSDDSRSQETGSAASGSRQPSAPLTEQAGSAMAEDPPVTSKKSFWTFW